jgi:hypothetical protein
MTLAEVQAQVFELLNASKNIGYGAFDSNPNYKPESIRDLVFDADYQVSRTICETVGHPHRDLYRQSFTVSTEGTWQRLPDADSKPEGINITSTGYSGSRAGTPAPADKIRQWLANPSLYGGRAVIDGYYDIAGNSVIFSGLSLTGSHFKVASHSASDTTLFSPDCYRPVLIALAIAPLLAKLEDYMGAASWYSQLGVMGLQAISSGKIVVPEVLAYQETR